MTADSGSGSQLRPRRIVACRRGQESGAAYVDHLDGLVDRDEARPTCGAKRLTLTATRSIRPIPCSSNSVSWSGRSRRARMPA